MMAHDRRTVSTLGPVAASCVSARGRKPTGWVRARQDVMHVHRIPAPTYSVPLFGQCRLFRDVDGIRMQIVNVLRDHDPLALYQGPLPIRSRAFTPASPPGSVVLRYARQLVRVEPAALASARQCASAPSSPPKSAPLPLLTLVTKKVIGAC